MTDDSFAEPRRRHARGLDAGFNRLAEALRTVEDRLRFDRSLPTLPGRWRAIRHDVAALRREVEGLWGPTALWRDVASDPGAPEGVGPAAAGPRRRDENDLLVANLSRAREAARSIEEGLRAAIPGLAGHAERVRYAIYALESTTLGLWHRRARLADARLYVLLTSQLASCAPLDAARAAITGGAQMLQLREKHMSARELLPLARDLRELTAELGALLIINDRVTIATLCEADGVHLGQEDLPPGEARKILGPERIIGVSTHGEEQARRAEEDGADYVGVGPIFATRTKEHRAAVGTEYISVAARAAAVPGFAIGSVNRETLAEVLAAGARRVAVCTGIISTPDIEESARWFRERLDERAALEAHDDAASSSRASSP